MSPPPAVAPARARKGKRRSTPPTPEPAWHVYVVRTRDGSLYTGIATDVLRRLAEHRAGDGRGARYLRGRAPLDVVYRRKLGDRGLALRIEWRLKRQPRADKQAIVAENPSRRALLRRLGVEGPTRSGVPKAPPRAGASPAPAATPRKRPRRLASDG